MSFTVKNVRPLTNQEVFDIALRTMRNRDYKRAYDPLSQTCSYRSDYGPCAIGACIPDLIYHLENIPNASISSILYYTDAEYKLVKKLFENINHSLLDDLQICHDECRGQNHFESEMYTISQNFGLQFTALSENYPTHYDPNKDERYKVA